MLCLLLQLGESAFALPCARIVRIIPKVTLRPVPQAPSCLAGLLHYRGDAVPVIDLCSLMAERPASHLLSSRIILMSYDGASGRLLGLLGEQIMETISLDETNLRPPSVRLDAAPYLGRIASTERGLIQMVEPEHLLPESLRRQLYPVAA